MDKETLQAFYIYLNSQQTAQEYLFNCYQKLGEEDAEAKSYQNCNAFIYYLQHSKEFYKNGRELETLLQPILFFYGMGHLLKAVLLTKRPYYPESTSVLAHGVSSRKRKKKHYKFIEDEVKVQHKGLFPYFTEHLYQMKSIPFEKISMKHLFSLIPELTSLFYFGGKKHLIEIGKLGSTSLTFPESILDGYHLTRNSFIKRIASYLPNIKKVTYKNQIIHLNLDRPFTKQTGPFFIHTNQTIHFPHERESFIPISEVMIHYLLLYNLSMVSRYEAEWWGDLLVTKPEIDYPLIAQFLTITAKKVPLLLGEILIDNLNMTNP